MATFIGGFADATLTGTAADDLFRAGTGRLIVLGGGGFDTLDYVGANLAGDGVRIVLSATPFAGSVTKRPFGSGSVTDTFVEIERVVGTDWGDVIVGSDFVTSNPASRIEIEGRLGFDGDRIDGRFNSFNLVDYSLTRVDGLFIDLGAGFAEGVLGRDTLVGVVRVRGSAFADRIVGGDLSDMIEGGAGNDRISGLQGNDRIEGGRGSDIATYGTSLSSLSFVLLDAATRTYQVGGPFDGIDTLRSIERIEAAGRTVGSDIAVTGFDALFYLAANPDVRAAGLDPESHFRTSGVREGRDPNAFFSTGGYLAANADVRAAGVNPLDHYLATGVREGRDPGPLFDGQAYLGRNADVRAAGVNPLLHYLSAGGEEGRAASPAIGARAGVNGFDAQWYLFNNRDVAAAGLDPEAHFRANGAREGRDPNAFFDSGDYLARYPDVAASGLNPLSHYVAFGAREGRDPSAAFDTRLYLLANPDVAASGLNPLLHYLGFGAAEGRAAPTDGLLG